MEAERSLPRLQDPTTGPYPEPDKSNTHALSFTMEVKLSLCFVKYKDTRIFTSETLCVWGDMVSLTLRPLSPQIRPGLGGKQFLTACLEWNRDFLVIPSINLVLIPTEFQDPL
jgi:hypothetical protein